MKDVVSKSFPESDKTYYANDFGAMGDAMMNCTEAIQKTKDLAFDNFNIKGTEQKNYR